MGWPERQGIACAAGDVSAPAANVAAVVNYAAVAGERHVITGVAYSYSAAPTGGNLKIEDVSGTVVFSMDLSAAGAGVVLFPEPKKSAAPGTALVITLAAGGASCTGKVSVLNHWTEG